MCEDGREAKRLCARETKRIALHLLPAEILLQIANQFSDEDPPISLIALSSTCKSLHLFVEVQGWKAWLFGKPGSISACQPDGEALCQWRYKVQRYHLNNVSWQKQRLVAHRASINQTATFGGANRSNGCHAGYWRQARDEAVEPFLRLGQDWLLLFLRSEVRVWHTNYLKNCLRERNHADGRWAAPELSKTGIDMDDAQIVDLPDKSAPLTRWQAMRRRPGEWASKSAVNPTKNISACCAIDSAGTNFIVGRVDGSLEHYQLPTSLSTRPKSSRLSSASQTPSAPWQQYAPKRLTFEATQLSTLDGPRRCFGMGQSSTGQSVQALSHSRDLVCSVTRDGTICLFKADRDEEDQLILEWRLLWHFKMGRQCWSCHLDEGAPHGQAPRWLAIGSKGAEALFLFPLHPTSHRPCEPIILNTLHTFSGRPEPSKSRIPFTGGQGQCRVTSTFALAQPSKECQAPLHSDMLVAGFYDAVVRVYDLRQVTASVTGRHLRLKRQDSLAVPAVCDEPLFSSDNLFGGEDAVYPLHSFKTLCPMMHFRDRFDSSAIYSLAIGGGNGTHILAGTATSGNVKVFDTRHAHDCFVPNTSGDLPDRVQLFNTLPPSSKTGWSAFAGYPSKSPTFSLALDLDFIIGATDRKLFDLVFTTTPLKREAKAEDQGRPVAPKGDHVGLAYYCLDKMTLQHAEP
ncbi:hypothetical protein K437DRAFT_258041 [Tilletiaria anomala UBC 951]|uniref:F-box domain-containing protein n=1 Tax=Tilletiaria anomala (strain ATCC 24038 / CBS 436.72 / UBC 951) TaxID=1037660 RepID=A0A066VTS6_TILAU|nr:uncharacterized protein K437DRAFT_258041 [Tilletiaria anomala UBC 951]KDN41960.1 hypothetical protein K437DRAFT_258041 [Tilletiaria anomala UBC 951]